MAATVIPLLALAVIIWVLWTTFSANAEARRNPQRVESATRTEDERRRIVESLRDQLSREPLGSALAERLWQRLMTEAPNNGVIYDRHRDFCGQGLIRTAEGVMLADVQDGGSYFGAAIAEWATGRDFVTFFARQSDFSMSGWDAGEPIFFTEDDWYRNNQRLTRAVMERYLSRL